MASKPTASGEQALGFYLAETDEDEVFDVEEVEDGYYVSLTFLVPREPIKGMTSKQVLEVLRVQFEAMASSFDAEVELFAKLPETISN